MSPNILDELKVTPYFKITLTYSDLLIISEFLGVCYLMCDNYIYALVFYILIILIEVAIFTELYK